MNAIAAKNGIRPKRDIYSQSGDEIAPGSTGCSHRARRAAGWSALVTRLGPNEFRRRLWHFTPGGLALLGTFIPHDEPVAVWVLVATAVFCACLATLAWRSCRLFQRPEESSCLMSILGYAAGIVPLFLLFPSQPELALTVAGVIAFGDGSATLFGLLFGQAKLPWNHKKTWVGLTAFVLAALPMAALIYWLGAIPPIGGSIVLACVVPTVLGAALVESLPHRLNDNIFVSCSAAAIVIAMHGFLVGWA